MISKTDNNNNGVAVLPAGYQEFCNIWTECESRNYITGHLMYRPDCPKAAKKAGFKDKHKQTRVSWKTEYGLFRQEIIDRDFLDPNFIVGKRFGKETNYHLTDIDTTSDLHPENNPGALEKYLEIFQEIGLVEFTVVQSGDSGGLHVFAPLPFNVPSWAIAKLVDQLIRKNGYEPKSGQLEPMPNADSREKGREKNPSGKNKMFQGHRLPGQHGWALLNSFYEPELDQSLTAFVRKWDDAKACQDEDLFRESIEAFIKANTWSKAKTKTTGEPRPRRFALQSVLDRGWTGEGQSNELFGAIAAYCVEVKGCKTVTQVVVEGMEIAQNTPGYDSFCAHQHELEQRMRDWAKVALNTWSVKDKTVEYTPVRNLNQERAELAQNRIRTGAVKLKGQVFSTVRGALKALKDITGAAIKTLYKYKELWIHLVTGGLGLSQPTESSQVESQKESQSSQCENRPNFVGGVERVGKLALTGVLHLASHYKGVNPPYIQVEDAPQHPGPASKTVQNQNLAESHKKSGKSQDETERHLSRHPQNQDCIATNKTHLTDELNLTKRVQGGRDDRSEHDRNQLATESIYAPSILYAGRADEPRTSDRDVLQSSQTAHPSARSLSRNPQIELGYERMPDTPYPQYSRTGELE